MKTLEFKFDELTTFELKNAKGGVKFKAGSDLSSATGGGGGGGSDDNDSDGDGLDDNIGGEYHW